jgi:hypothetical protein
MPDCLPHILPHLDFSFIRETHRRNSNCSAADAEFTTGRLAALARDLLRRPHGGFDRELLTLACVLRSLAIASGNGPSEIG